MVMSVHYLQLDTPPAPLNDVIRGGQLGGSGGCASGSSVQIQTSPGPHQVSRARPDPGQSSGQGHTGGQPGYAA